jgi:hypothetical protein
MATAAIDATVRLPRSHPKQVLIEQHAAKRVVVCAGRRAGKTTLAAKVACNKLKEGRRVLLSSPTQSQADAFWEKCKVWLTELIRAGIVVKNEQSRILTMPYSGGRIKVKTASDADGLRGDYADFLVLDECALLAPDAWEKVGAPMLLDNDGDAWFISTPRRRNWFFHLYQKAMADETGRWKAWHFTSYDNPHLSTDALDELQSDMTEEDIEQEIKAVFLEGQGAVFRKIDENLIAPVGATPADHAGHEFVMGVDWGRQNDATVLSVGCVDCRCEVALDRFTKIAWSIQRERLKALYDLWKPYTVLAEANSIGGPNIEALQEEDIPVMGFDMTGTSKGPLIKAMVRSLERNEYKWLPDPIGKGEFEAYEMKQSTSGNTQYSAPPGMHDDVVVSRCLTLRASGMWGSLA